MNSNGVTPLLQGHKIVLRNVQLQMILVNRLILIILIISSLLVTLVLLHIDVLFRQLVHLKTLPKYYKHGLVTIKQVPRYYWQGNHNLVVDVLLILHLKLNMLFVSMTRLNIVSFKYIN
jgi:hypothetical protein